MVPEVILSLLAHIRETTHPHTIHLLPPHEHLSSTLRQTYVPNKSSLAPPLDNSPSIHTGFAWLGHGAITHRSDNVNFLELMHKLNVSEEEMKMADNYYTILSNRVPEIWFDQGVELGGGQPFTVGVEGDERNDRHVVSSVLLHGHHSYWSSFLFFLSCRRQGTWILSFRLNLQVGLKSCHSFVRRRRCQWTVIRLCEPPVRVHDVF